VGPFEEDEEGTGVAIDVVKVQGEDPDTPGYLRGTGRFRDVGDLGSCVRLPWLDYDEAPGPYITIPQYWFKGGPEPSKQIIQKVFFPIGWFHF